MMVRNSIPFFVLLLVTSVPFGCASKLKRDLTDNAPSGLEAKLNLAEITFLDVSTREPVVVADYMDAKDRDYLLLTFGSEGCVSCTDKATKLTNDVIGKHPFFLTDAGQRFEIVGVNTDALQGFSVIRYLRDYPFIQWNDAAGITMLKYFAPEGMSFSVPLTVMISREGIMWRIPPSESYTVEELMARVERTLANGGDGDDDGTDETDGSDSSDDGSDDAGDDATDDGSDDGPDIPDVKPTDLEFVGPGRLKKVTTRTCGVETETALSDFLGDADLQFVQVAKGSCSGTCLANAETLSLFAKHCAATGNESCGAVTLQTAELTNADCTAGVRQGGDLFFSVFDTFFHRAPVEVGWDLVIPELAGPLVFGFNRDGVLVFADRGDEPLTLQDLKSKLASGDLNLRAKGPDFPIFTDADNHIGFSALRERAEYTIISILQVDPVCPPCIEELRHWSEPGELVDICQASQGKCQVIAMEDGQNYGSTTEGLRQWLNEIKNDMPDPEISDRKLWEGIRTPLALDPVPKEDELNRFFNGYLYALQYEAGIRGPRTVIYNREGRLLHTFTVPVDGEPDLVTPAVKKLIQPE